MTPIAPAIEAFLREHLARQRDASQHTCDSYATSFQLLFEFAAKKFNVSPSALTLEQLDATLIGAFLEYLEQQRRNSPDTRNVRLAAIKSFFRFLEYRHPAALDQIRRVLAIPFKKTDQRLVPYLTAARNPSAARCPRSGNAGGDPRSGHAARDGVRRSARIGVDRLAAR